MVAIWSPIATQDIDTVAPILAYVLTGSSRKPKNNAKLQVSLWNIVEYAVHTTLGFTQKSSSIFPYNFTIKSTSKMLFSLKIPL